MKEISVTFNKSLNFVPRLIVFCLFLGVMIGVIAYARGYRFDLNNKEVKPTGILAVSSFPKAAKIYINNQLKGVTDYNITSLPPGKYEVTLRKEGYTTWSKSVVLKGELVVTLDARLFPINPSLSPLTNLGITKIFPVEQSEKILIFSQNNSLEKDGIYIFNPNASTISFLAPLKLLLLKSNLPLAIDFNKITNVYFSPDSKQAIVVFDIVNTATDISTSNQTAYLISLEEENLQSFEVSNSKDTLLAAWDEEKKLEIAKIMETFPRNIQKVASDSFKIIAFSPDKTKVLYQTDKEISLPLAITPPMIASNQTPEERNLKTETIYVYDKKEDKNYKISNDKFLISNQLQNSNTQNNQLGQLDQLEINHSIFWYPDSQHLVINEEKQISVVYYDGQNKQIVYSGPFDQGFLGISTDGKLLILTNLNSKINKLPDIYAVGI